MVECGSQAGNLAKPEAAYIFLFTDMRGVLESKDFYHVSVLEENLVKLRCDVNTSLDTVLKWSLANAGRC